MARPGDELAEQIEATIEFVRGLVCAFAVCCGVFVNLLLLMHISQQQQ